MKILLLDPTIRITEKIQELDSEFLTKKIFAAINQSLQGVEKLTNMQNKLIDIVD